jgi:two-component sensor histidine kinase
LIAWFRDTLNPPIRDGDPSETLPDGVSPLRLRLLFIVTIALTPIAVVSVLQGLDRAQRDAADVHERLIETARAAASHEGNVLASAEQVLRAVANLPDVQLITPDCNRALEGAMSGLPDIVNLTRIAPRGRIVCASLRRSIGLDLSGRSIFQNARKEPGKFFSLGPVKSSITNAQIVGGMLGFNDTHGDFDGAVGIALDLGWLNRLLEARQVPQGAVAAVFNRSGKIIASTAPEIAAPVFAQSDPRAIDALQSGLDSRGHKWVFAATPLLQNDVYVGFAMREATLFAPTYVHVTTDFLMPVLMIGLAWIAIWFGTDRLVTRWIMYLKRISGAYRAGHYTIRPQLDAAPGEFQLLGQALADMASAIQDRDRALRDAVAQKTELIREIHHRVKNNLQIVMSLLSLQQGQVHDPSSRAALAQAQLRINALALVHRMLHEIEDQTMIDLKRLLTDLSRQIADGLGSGTGNLNVEIDVVACSVSADVAIPLALFTVEALTNTYKYAFVGIERPGKVQITLRQTGADMTLAISDNGVGYDLSTTKRSIGSRLIATFGQQVGGVSSVRSEPGKGTTVEIRFPNPGLGADQSILAAS